MRDESELTGVAPWRCRPWGCGGSPQACSPAHCGRGRRISFYSSIKEERAKGGTIRRSSRRCCLAVPRLEAMATESVSGANAEYSLPKTALCPGIRVSDDVLVVVVGAHWMPRKRRDLVIRSVVYAWCNVICLPDLLANFLLTKTCILALSSKPGQPTYSYLTLRLSLHTTEQQSDTSQWCTAFHIADPGGCCAPCESDARRVTRPEGAPCDDVCLAAAEYTMEARGDYV